MPKDLSKLFSPSTIAIYGVSNNPSKIGSVIFNNIKSSGFSGRIYPINPKYKEVYGITCYEDSKSIPEEVDLAIMVIPAEFTLKVIEDCHTKNIPNLIIISAGYGEMNDQGKKLEDDMVDLASKYNINILGPNCLGMIIASSKMNASFAAEQAIAGNIAFLSQSGAICTTLLDIAKQQNIGFSHFISIGNKSIINENDLLEYLLNSQEVKVIGLYLEEFENGIEFCSMQNRLGIWKPIVVLSPGQSEQAQTAIKSHTGSLASSTITISTALKKNGITRVNTIAQLYSLMMGFNWITLPKGNKVAILTNAGGVGIIATDALVSSGLEIAQLSNETKNKLKQVLPPESNFRNPIDLIGDAKEDRYESAFNILNEAIEVDSIIVILTPQLVTQIEETAKFLISAANISKKCIIPVFLGKDYIQTGIERMHDNKIAAYSDLNHAVYVLNKLTEYNFYQQNKNLKEFNINKFKEEKKIDLNPYLKNELVSLPEEVTLSLMQQFNINLPKTKLVSSFEEVKKFAFTIGFPVVLKATSEDIIHKTDVKGVFVGIKNEENLKEKFDLLNNNILKSIGRAPKKIIIQEQIKVDLELLIGAKREGDKDMYVNSINDLKKRHVSTFGHILIFGTGGIYAEVYNDIFAALLPLSDVEIKELINSTKVSKIINGFRGQQPLAFEGIVDVIKKLQRLVLTYPEIAEIDINPAMITNEKCILADVKILIK